MSHFSFLKAEWPDIHNAAERAESLALSDPRGAGFYARRALELAIHWMYQHDPSLHLPHNDSLKSLLDESTFRDIVGRVVLNKMQFIRKLGNFAVHSQKDINEEHALTAVRELFHIGYWFARTYARGDKPSPDLTFDPGRVPRTVLTSRQTLAQLQRLEAELQKKDENLAETQSDKAVLNKEVQRLQEEVAAIRRASQAQPDTHDYSEAQTRSDLIDLLLFEAGWSLDKVRDREFEVQGMPNNTGIGYVDYVLWGDDGKPLGIVEAKRTGRDATEGQHQAKLYADCLEQMYGQRPIIFYTNGYDHWIWDDEFYPARKVQGFYTKDEIELLIQRRTSRKRLDTGHINPEIVERHYQIRAIRRIGDTFENEKRRKALIVMATGAGKTRTVVALTDLLMRSNWIKRALFLADRKELVKQAVDAYKRHLPDASPINLLTDKDAEGRVYVSTYPTMMNLIDKEMPAGKKRFGVGYFDLVVIDEAHRSVFQKYRAIFEYFDSLLIGLTATPKDEIDRNTYSLFQLETGVPTDAYSLEEAVKDGFLVPPRSVSVPLKFQRQGITYDELSEDEKEQWDSLEWDEDGEIPDRVDPEALNRWLFNKDTVDKVLEHLMTRGQKVAGGDRLGKTIIFAKNHAHAQFIAERFDANYPHYKGQFARVIDYKTEYTHTLIDEFKKPDAPPHIAISVDMLDTGIDVPEVVNLVFFKMVRSKTKFWQMVGRGTRLSPNLFGPGKDKEYFFLFDYCQNLEFFSANPEIADGVLPESLIKRLFKSRLELIQQIDQRIADEIADTDVAWTQPIYGEPSSEVEMRQSLTERLHREVREMNVDNFIVRPKRQWVEKFQAPEAWSQLSEESLSELAQQIAGLPSELKPESEESKRFDLLLLNVQLATLRSEPSYNRLVDQVKTIASLLEEMSNIPSVREQLPLIEELQTEAWWEDVTLPMLERVRVRLRNLVQLIEKKKRTPIYTDFEDAFGEETNVELSGLTDHAEFARFREKAREFLKDHEGHLALHKVRWNEPLTPTDLDELERMLIEAGVGTEDVIARAKQENRGLGLFIRSLVGLDREAAKRAFARFLEDKTATANQIEFINMIIDHLTEQGVMDPSLLYESPFIDKSPTGPDGIFPTNKLEELLDVLEGIQDGAVA